MLNCEYIDNSTHAALGLHAGILVVSGILLKERKCGHDDVLRIFMLKGCFRDHDLEVIAGISFSRYVSTSGF